MKSMQAWNWPVLNSCELSIHLACKKNHLKHSLRSLFLFVSPCTCHNYRCNIGKVVVGILSNIWTFSKSQIWLSDLHYHFFFFTRIVDFNLHLFSICKIEHLVLCLRTICISFSKFSLLLPLAHLSIRFFIFSTFRISLCIRTISSVCVCDRCCKSISLLCHLSYTSVLQIC